MISVADIEAAAGRLDGVVVRTPLLRNAELDRVAGGPVLVKPECFQAIGSFKIRGAYNLMSQLSPEQAEKGVVAWSSGNHAQGVALAGKLLGIHAAIVMPEDAPAAKLENTRRLGGEIITYDRYTEDREAIARAVAAERGAEIVPSYEDERIIAGQGTVGLEIADQSVAMGLPVDQVLICCGGGGLTAGCAIALKARLPGVDIYPVEPEDFDDTTRSLASGERVAVTGNPRSICDALLTDKPGQLTFDIMNELVVKGLTVSDDDVRRAMRFAFRHLKIVVEPGGAAALAAVLEGKLETAGKTTCVVFSGGNVDVELYAAIQAEPA
ncbi:MAG: pyridoxal-phosphate dependent enzyme [Woeseiaceae bacterium]|nr:pyridoxal-phosphate dependent enzyme [Woeseiaceae bacterium]NIP21050.1 pyridoxal-phosphate dependent enzyme [Woeseiaceae bacterium]NIS90022.1 pyridoxal-phosphate dependent enzyme [Woeseiaceae bacterium]